MVWSKSFLKITFEGNCQILVNDVTNDHEEVSILNIYKDIKTWRRKFEKIRFTHILRNNN